MLTSVKVQLTWQFTLARQEDLITLFQKMVWFVVFLPMVQEILTMKFKKGADSAKNHDITLTLVANTS